ncbi:nuclear transport factor 2 family protein [Micromonospora sp. RP3T]|uniref:nuclear transport factor 2 family protein n=1 Tax=Micromonospora sp. RP3T TaxID=2135446 RepID=UPI001E397B7A|nr:nuclear transport factor 2 family protein [Micromonospora sp. RP3T]
MNWDDLPAVITGFLPAHEAREADAAVSAFAADAVVTDEGRSHRGVAEIRSWLVNGGSEYTYTTEFVGAHRVGEGRFDVAQHLEGDFPGGSATLHYRFVLAGNLITRLTIEP